MTRRETAFGYVRVSQTNDRLLDNLESLLFNLSGRDLTNAQLDRMARILYWRGERMVCEEAGKRDWDEVA